MSDNAWSMVILAGLAGWIVSTIIFIFRAFPSRGVFVVQQARIWGVALLASFGIWILGLINA